MRQNVYLVITALLLVACSASAQRVYTFNDSTVYQVAHNFQLVAGRHQLYKVHNGGTLQAVRDFTNTPLPSTYDPEDYYIRDVDYWDTLHWYVLYGSRYISDTTFVYETMDGGINWNIKQNFLPQTNWNFNTSINQMQLEGDSTIYLFNGYYISSVIFSKDRGQTWTRWFQSYIAHYYQIYDCPGKGKYLIGLNGDAVRSFSFRIPDSLYGKTTENWYSGCHSITPSWCHYESPSVIGYFNYMQHHIGFWDAVCTGAANVPVVTAQKEWGFYPNPATDLIFLKNLDANRHHYEIYDFTGRKLLSGISYNRSIDIRKLPPGNYLLRLSDGFAVNTRRLVKE